mmetsp:Transcript_12335/g.34636  ORF Transcript_12335/g.34636 Transcript_12335/m.34636 type:complete len:131 (+) Transcript_12335:3-395(+)
MLPLVAGNNFALYAAVLMPMGLLVSWCAACCNNPVFSEIVPEHLRSMIFAYDRCLEGGIAAMITPAVGVIAQRVFHYHTPTPGEDLTPSDREANALALGNALVVRHAGRQALTEAERQLGTRVDTHDEAG